MKSIGKFIVTTLFVLFILPTVSAQLKYTPEMDDYIGDWISHSRSSGVLDKQYLRIKKRGNYVSVHYKSEPSQRWVDEGYTTAGPHYTQIEHLSFSNESFKWHYVRSDDKGGNYEYYHTLVFNNGQLMHTEKWYHNGKQMLDSFDDIYEPMDNDW